MGAFNFTDKKIQVEDMRPVSKPKPANLFDQLYIHPDSPLARANNLTRQSELKTFPPGELSAPATGGLRLAAAAANGFSGAAVARSQVQQEEEPGGLDNRDTTGEIFKFYAMYLRSAKTDKGTAYYHKDNDQEILFHKKVSGDNDIVVETTKNPDDMSDEEIGAMILVAKEAFASNGSDGDCDIEAYGTAAFIEKVKAVADKMGVSVTVFNSERPRQRG